jgi:hypothetical protein
MKILPPTKNSQEPIDVESKTIKVDKFFNDKEKTIKLLLKIEKKTIKIDKLLKRSLASKIKLNEKLRVKKEEESFDKKEQELEKKKPKKMKGMRLPSLPSFGIFDWIKNFISNVIMGFIAVRLIKFLPDLIRLLPIISKVMDFFIDVGGKLLDSLVTFVDWGYKAYDATRGFIKNIFGEDGAKTFEDLSSKFSTFMNIALIAGMLALSGSKKSRGGLGGKGGKIGIDSKGRKVGTKAQERYQRRYGKGKFEDRFGTKNAKKLEKLRRTAGGAGGARAAGTTGARTVAKGGARLATKGIPIVGPLIDFAVRTLIFHEPLGKAAAGAVGVAVGQALGGWLGGAIGGIVGSVIPIAGTLLGGSAGVIIGQLIGGFVGDAIGTSLYDFIGEIGGSTQLAGGGTPVETTRKSNVSGPAARTLKQKKTKRTLTPIPRKISPGASVGGKEKFQQLFPDTQKDNTDTTGKEKQNPYQYLTKSAENIGKAQYFGPLINLGMKANLGDSPNKTDYFLAAQGLNSWMNRILDFRGVAMAGGGEVNAQMLGMGEDYTRVIAKSLEESVSPSIDKTTKDLMRNLMLQKVEPKDEDKKPDEGGADGGVGGQYSPEGLQGDIYKHLLSKGMSDIHALGIMANISRESEFRPGVSEKGGPGVGLFQYSSEPRKSNFLKAVPNYATNWKGQIDFAIKEDYAPQYLQKKYSSSQEAADDWMRRWERPAEYIQATEGPKKHREYLAGLEKYRTGKGYNIPASGDLKLGGGDGKFIQGNSGRSGGVHFHIGTSNPGDGTGVAAAGFKTIKHFLGKKSVYIGRSREFIPSGANDEQIKGYIARGQAAHRKTELDVQVGGAYGQGNKVAFPLALKNMKYSSTDGYGVSADIVGTNAFVGHGRYKPDGSLAEQQKEVLSSKSPDFYYEKGGETLDGIHLAMIGEKGKEYVLDTGSTKTIQKELPGLLVQE